MILTPLLLCLFVIHYDSWGDYHGNFERWHCCQRWGRVYAWTLTNLDYVGDFKKEQKPQLYVYTHGLYFLYGGSDTRMNLSGRQIVLESENKDYSWWVDQETLDIISFFTSKGGLDNTFTEVCSSFKWGWFLRNRIGDCETNMKGVFFLFTITYFLG